MAKKTKKNPNYDYRVYNEKPENIDGMKKLHVGDVIMYKTKQLFDKTTVESVDKHNRTAKLSNGVIVSLGILPNNSILRIGTSTENTEITLWDENSEIQYKSFIGKRNIKRIAEALRKVSDSNKYDDEVIIKISEKLNRMNEKYKLL